LQISLTFAPFSVDSQYVVDLCLVTAAARCQALTDKIRFVANETDVEHGAIVEAGIVGGKWDWVAVAAAIWCRRHAETNFS
jgi:hypothetical protein